MTTTIQRKSVRKSLVTSLSLLLLTGCLGPALESADSGLKHVSARLGIGGGSADEVTVVRCNAPIGTFAIDRRNLDERELASVDLPRNPNPALHGALRKTGCVADFVLWVERARADFVVAATLAYPVTIGTHFGTHYFGGASHKAKAGLTLVSAEGQHVANVYGYAPVSYSTARANAVGFDTNGFTNSDWGLAAVEGWQQAAEKLVPHMLAVSGQAARTAQAR